MKIFTIHTILSENNEIIFQFLVDHSVLTIIFNGFRLPWEQHTFEGWMADVVFGSFLTTFYMITNPAFLTLFVSICEYHRAFYKMFKAKLDQIISSGKAMAKAKSHQSTIKNNIKETILFHISVTK